MLFSPAVATWVRSRTERLHANPWSFAFAIGVLALLLRLRGLGEKPFWLDEVTSLRRATATLPGLATNSLHNGHYPSYFLLLWVVAKIGSSQSLLRLPSAIFGAIAASLTCAIGARVSGLRGGIIAGLLMALSPFQVQFGQEARSYTLASSLILTALYGVVRLAQEPAAAAVPLNQRGTLWQAWSAYGLGTAAALDVLNVAIPWFLAANFSALAIARAAGSAKDGFWRNWITVQLLIVGAWAPMIALVWLNHSGTVLDGAGWVPATTSKTIWSAIAPVYLLRISSFVTFDVLPAAVPWLAFAVGTAAALGAWRLRRDPAMRTVLICSALVLPLGLFFVSLFVPVLVPRYFIWGAAPFFVFAGEGLARLPGKYFAAAAASLGAIGLFNLLPYYSYETKPRWDLLADKLAAITRPGDAVLLDSYYAYSVLSVFAKRTSLDHSAVRLTWQLSDALQIAPGRDVWAVYGRTGQVTKQSAENYRQSISSLGHPSLEESVGRYLVLWRFIEPNGPKPDALAVPATISR